jgi:hypothetical protein
MSAAPTTSLEGFHATAKVRAVMITKPGDVDVLEVADRPTREPGDGEVRKGCDRNG